MNVEKIDGDTFGVASSVKGKGDYTVLRAAGEWSCDCKAFEYGGGKACKHIVAAQEQLAIDVPE